MKAKPFERKYDVLLITESTSYKDIGEFVKCQKAVSTKLYGIGFTAKCRHSVSLNTGVKEIFPGDVIIRNSADEIAIIDYDTYSMIFKTTNH